MVKDIQKAEVLVGADHKKKDVTTLGGVKKDWIKAITI
jgi:hypothetical protein